MKISWQWGAAMALAFAAASSGCATFGYGKDDFRMQNGALMRDNSAVTLQGVHYGGLVESGGALSEVVSALAGTARAGGNAIAFDLAGFNDDGTGIDSAAIETVGEIAARIRHSRMSGVLRVLGDSQEDAFRSNAVRTAARALKGEQRLVYWIDGPHAAELAATFKAMAPNLVVLAPDNGDIAALDAAPPAPPDRAVCVIGAIPELSWNHAHFLLPGTPEQIAALDEATVKPEERMSFPDPPLDLLTEEERAEGFVPLFNGENLDGWWFWGSNTDGFTVEDGVITWVERGASAIMTARRYEDFVLRLEWKMPGSGTNSGVFIRAPRAARQSKLGMEIQIRGDHGVEPSPDQTGAIYDVVAPTVVATRPSGEWNEIEIRCEGPMVVVHINGELVQDTNIDEIEELRYRIRDGFIGLQDHGDFVAFRNVRIKTL